MASKDARTAKQRIAWILMRSGATHTQTMLASSSQGRALPLYDPTHSSSGATEPTHSAIRHPRTALQPHATANFRMHKRRQ
ncbi:hypothetical protein ACHAW6_000271 [Cyclotella cf. meneghiniana]